MVRQHDRHVEPATKIMTLREYRQYAEKIYGPKSINDFMMRVMNRASMGAALTRETWDKMVVGIKLKHAEIMMRGMA